MKVREVYARRILNPTRIRTIRYSLNPYVGCSHKCVYCFADYMRLYTGHDEPWGEFVDVKVNAPYLLRKEIKKAELGPISIGVVTDPYQPIERKYEITRKCLMELLPWTGGVSVLTKSALILRDADILRELRNVEVGVSISTFNAKRAKLLEPRVPSPAERLKVLAELRGKGISVWVFLSPFIPGISDDDRDLLALFEEAGKCGVEYVLVDILNPYPSVVKRMNAVFDRWFTVGKAQFKCYLRNREKVKNEVKSVLSALSHRIGIPVRFAF